MRITEKQLEIQVGRLNRLMDTPAEPYAGAGNPCPGNYHIDHAYGGVALHQMHASGGITDVFNNGHMPKKELFGLIAAYIDGIQVERDKTPRQAWADVLELAERGASDLDCYLSDGSPKQDGYTPEEVNALYDLSERALQSIDAVYTHGRYITQEDTP